MSSVARTWVRAADRFGARVHPLIPILVLVAVLRLWGLASMPVLYFDSGAYLGEGRFLASVAQRSVGALLHPAPDAPANPVQRIVRTLETGTAGHPPDLAKPGHAILLAMSILVFGTSSFAAGGAVSALAGLGTVAATYALGTAGWNRCVGIVAAVLLAISGQHLVYSREPLVEADGLLFATLGSLVYLRQVARPDAGSVRSLFGAGVLYGIAFTCNNRLSFLALSLGIVEVAVWRARGWRQWQATFVRAVALGVGFVVPLASIQLAYEASRLVARANGVTPGWVDYAQQLANFWRMNPPSRLRLDQWPTYFVDLVWMDGWPVLALLGVGLMVVLVRRSWSRAELLLMGWLLVPLVLYSTYSSGEIRMRNFSLILPWLMVTASIGLWWLAGRSRYPTAVATVAVLALMALALPRGIALVTAPNAMARLMATLREDHIEELASTNGPVLSFLAGEEHTNARLRPAFINDVADLEQLAQRYTYIEVDMQAYWSPGQVNDRFDRAVPLFEAANGNDTWYLAFLLESRGIQWGGWGALLDEWRHYRDQATTLRLYRLSDLLSDH
jgi:4-amino-4-deoxy-L-arabinose transferase-like glycosyltransferase